MIIDLLCLVFFLVTLSFAIVNLWLAISVKKGIILYLIVIIIMIPMIAITINKFVDGENYESTNIEGLR